jgi:transcription antitermination protein NusB
MLDRRKARHQALRILYQRELTGAPVARILLDRSWDVPPVEPEDLEELPDLGEPLPFCLRVLDGVGRHQGRIDSVIESFSENWTLARMPFVDRNILRIAVWELLAAGDVPPSATINEAVEMAKLYGGEDSSKFVNGILGKVAEETQAGRLERLEPLPKARADGTPDAPARPEHADAETTAGEEHA